MNKTFNYSTSNGKHRVAAGRVGVTKYEEREDMSGAVLFVGMLLVVAVIATIIVLL